MEKLFSDSSLSKLSVYSEKTFKAGLYIHIPYCRKKCSYCAFNSCSSFSDEETELYINEIKKQLYFFKEKLPGLSFNTVYLGGGTPNILPEKQLNSLFRLIEAAEIKPFEFTIEANPAFINKDFLNLLNSSMVTRLSLGIQSFNPDMLKILGRNCSAKENLDALELIKKNCSKNLSLDLIQGIPGQKLNSGLEDIEKALKYEPAHISVYSLIAEENTELGKKLAAGQLKSRPETEEELYFETEKTLSTAAFNHYEISNYARAGKECLHNLKYWELMPYIGLGVSAAGTLPAADKLIRLTGPEASSAFIKKSEKFWNMKIEKLTPEAFLKDYLIMGLRLKKGINRKNFRKIFSAFPEQLLPESFNYFEKNSYLQQTADCTAFSEKAYCIMNKLLIKIMEEAENIKKISINWPLQDD